VDGDSLLFELPNQEIPILAGTWAQGNHADGVVLLLCVSGQGSATSLRTTRFQFGDQEIDLHEGFRLWGT
jgi:hypothetical protein